MKTLLASAAVLAILISPAAAAPKLTGAWCHTLSIRNGHDDTGAFIPPTNIFRRGSDCDPDKRVELSPRKLRGLEYRLQDDGDLAVEGWPRGMVH